MDTRSFPRVVDLEGVGMKTRTIVYEQRIIFGHTSTIYEGGLDKVEKNGQRVGELDAKVIGGVKERNKLRNTVVRIEIYRPKIRGNGQKKVATLKWDRSGIDSR